MAPRRTQKRKNNKNRSTRKIGGENTLRSISKFLRRITSNIAINDTITDEFNKAKKRAKKEIEEDKNRTIKTIKRSDKSYLQKAKEINNVKKQAKKIHAHAKQEIVDQFRNQALPHFKILDKANKLQE